MDTQDMTLSLENPCREEENNAGLDEQSLWSGTTLRQKCSLAFVVVGNFLTRVCMGVPGPFLTRVVTARGGSLFSSAVILQTAVLTMAFAGLVFGKYQPYLGCKKLFISGLLIFGVCQVCFGLLQYISDIHVFVIVGIVIRIIQGIGSGAYTVSSLTLICQEFPKHIGKVFGIVEAAFAAGYLMGPAVSGYMFQIGGMLFPMAVTGGILLVITPLSLLLLKRYNFDDTKITNYTLTDLFWNVRAVLILGAVSTVSSGIALCASVLTNYLGFRGFTVASAGIVLFVMEGSYCIASIPIGFVSGLKSWIAQTAMVIGCIGCLLVSLIFTASQTYQWIYVGTCFMGIFTALGFVPTLDELLKSCGGGADCTDISLNSAVSGAFYFAVGVSNFVLVTAGSALTTLLQSFSLGLLLTFVIGYFLTLSLALTIYIMKPFCYK